MSKHKTISLDFSQIYDGFSKCVSNGMRLWEAGTMLVDKYSDISLGLYELGQEEIGKSFSFLAAFSFADGSPYWQLFWDAWKNHKVKVHRAFLYELISPFRIEVGGGETSKLSGASLREHIFHEKEFSFYVNYDYKRKTFLLPEEEVKPVECMNRGATLAYLALTASSVQIGLGEGDKEVNYKIFGGLAFRLMTEEIYQQDMPRIFAEFSKQSDQHMAILRNLHSALEEGKGNLLKILGEQGKPIHIEQPGEGREGGFF